tara:strand:+ start:1249 stop:1434 length:186 start_codon:yes stop_codon:yes gene_type:complete
MGYVLKTFKVSETTNERFKEECQKSKVKQGDIIELLMIRWIKLKKSQDIKTANIYPKKQPS